MPIRINDDFFKEDLIGGTFKIDCREIVLTQNDSVSPLIMVSSGTLDFDIHLGFTSRFVISDSATVQMIDEKWSHSFSHILSGQSLPEEYYFSVSAIDVFGDKWVCSSVEVDFSYFPECYIVSLSCYLLKCERLVPRHARETIQLMFLDEIEYPRNSPVHSKVTYEGSEKSSIVCAIALGKAMGFTFIFGNGIADCKYYELKIYSENNENFPSSFEARIVEALKFLQAKELQYSVCEITKDDLQTIEICSVKEFRKSIFSPPIEFRRGQATDFFNILDLYLKYLCARNLGDNFSPISIRLSSIYQLTRVDLSAFALVLTVAIEGLLEDEFKELGKPSKTTLQALCVINKELDKLDLPKDIIERVKGSFGGIKKSRAKDKLIALVANGTISEGELIAWSALRNSSAHGKLHSDRIVEQDLLNQLFKAYSLLNKLVFKRIGYSGKFIDYSILGWPIAEFGINVQTEAETPITPI